MKKKLQVNIPVEKSKSETHTVLCKNCKEVVTFINGQDTKTCPNCGSIVQNIIK